MCNVYGLVCFMQCIPETQRFQSRQHSCTLFGTDQKQPGTWTPYHRGRAVDHILHICACACFTDEWRRLLPSCHLNKTAAILLFQFVFGRSLPGTNLLVTSKKRKTLPLYTTSCTNQCNQWKGFTDWSLFPLTFNCAFSKLKEMSVLSSSPDNQLIPSTIRQACLHTLFDWRNLDLSNTLPQHLSLSFRNNGLHQSHGKWDVQKGSGAPVVATGERNQAHIKKLSQNQAMAENDTDWCPFPFHAKGGLLCRKAVPVRSASDSPDLGSGGTPYSWWLFRKQNCVYPVFF